MKKLIYTLAVIVCAAAMVACGNKASENGRITKGSKSKMDTVSYYLGYINSFGIQESLPDAKLDWKVASDACEESMVNPTDVFEDTNSIKSAELLQEFFNKTRIERINKLNDEKLGGDTTKRELVIDLNEIDIFENDQERKEISWAMGYDMGSNLRRLPFKLQSYWFIKGWNEGIEKNSRIEFDKAQTYLQRFVTLTWPVENAEKSKEWLAEVEKQPNVKKHESGLLYRIDREGDANNKPTAESTVKVDYEGNTRDGVIFDSSYKRGEPIEFPLNGVIPGWTIGMQLVGKGGQITLWIPANMAYGAEGSASIGPNEALQFKVELHDIINPEPATEEKK